jgi:inorganic pyrophosphatase
VDCYLVTKEPLTAGSIVACEPVGLLLQDEDGEIDHKILAALPGQTVEVGPALEQELREFICAIFAAHPEMKIRVGPLLPREAALEHLQKSGSR